MNRHLTLRSGNPTLNAKTFSGLDVTAGATMTIMGTVHKTALGLLLLMTTALYTWNLPFRHFWRIWCGNFDRFQAPSRKVHGTCIRPIAGISVGWYFQIF